MNAWWESLTLFEQVVWAITIPVTVIFALQTIMTFAGIGGDEMSTDFDAVDHNSFELFNFRNFIHFFLGFGWSIIALESTISNKTILIGISALVGILLVAMVMAIFYGMSRMSQSGNLELINAIGQVGEVYLTIPGSQEGTGKIHVKVQGNLRELDALSSAETIPTGKWVKVVDIIDNKLLVVEPLAQKPADELLWKNS